MGTRSGDLDPSVMDYLCNATGKSVDEMYDIFNKKSGILGVSGISNDTRDVEAEYIKGNERAILTIKLFARRIADFIGQYYIRLGGCDLIIFSAGIGENGALFRKAIIDDVKEALHLTLNESVNDETFGGKEAIISGEDSAIRMVVIPTDEEVMIARDCQAAIQ